MNLTGFINNNIQGNPEYNAIGEAIDNYINDVPNYGVISQSIDDYVKTPGNNTNYGQLAMQTLGGMKPIQQNRQTRQINFKPTMMQPQYVNTNFQNQTSNIARNNLYNAIMR